MFVYKKSVSAAFNLKAFEKFKFQFQVSIEFENELYGSRSCCGTAVTKSDNMVGQKDELQTDLYPDLPIEVSHHILAYLDIKDLFSVRLVSKKLFSAVKEFCIKELQFDYNCCHYQFDFQLDNYFYWDEPINYKNAVFYLKPSTFLKCSSFNFRGLKRLRLDRVKGDKQIELAHINKLVQLQYLDFWMDECRLDGEVPKLSLPNLKVLFLGLLSAQPIEIDCPRVDALGLIVESDFSYVKFAHPESVKYLRIYRAYGSNLSAFKKLEVFECPFSPVVDGLLAIYEYLKELRVSLIWSSNELNIVQQTMKQLLSQKFVLNRKSVSIYLCDIPLTNQDDLAKFDDDFKHLNRTENRSLPLLVQEYARLPHAIHWFRKLDYCQLMSLTRNRPPTDFHSKFNSISCVDVVSQVQNAGDLIKFLGGCLSLSRLSIRDSNLTQAFYDQLPKSVLLISLEITEESPLNLDYNFLSHFSYLQEFVTNQPFSNQMLSALNKCRYFRVFTIEIQDQLIDIVREGQEFILRDSGTLREAGRSTELADLIESVNWLIKHFKAETNPD